MFHSDFSNDVGVERMNASKIREGSLDFTITASLGGQQRVKNYCPTAWMDATALLQVIGPIESNP